MNPRSVAATSELLIKLFAVQRCVWFNDVDVGPIPPRELRRAAFELQREGLDILIFDDHIIMPQVRYRVSPPATGEGAAA